MPNTIVTPTMIARESLMILKGALVAAGLFYRDHELEFGDSLQKGDTIHIRKPAAFVADEFSGTTNIQNISESKVPLTLDKHFDCSVEITSRELTLELDQLSKRVIAPQVLALAEAVNGYALGRYVGIPYFHDAGSMAFPDTVAKIATGSTVLDNNKVPVAGRNAVISPTAKATLLGIEAFHRADARGDSGSALRDASVGRNLGYDWWMDQQVQTHTAGTLSAGSPVVNGAVAEGATTMNIDGGVGTETIKEGDLFTVADVEGQFVFTADATAAGGAITGASFYPAAPAGGFPDNKAITIKTSHKANLAFHPNALALAVVPLALPMGGAKGEIVKAEGLAIRVVTDWDNNAKKNVMSLDLLCGAKAIQPELGMRILENP